MGSPGVAVGSPGMAVAVAVGSTCMAVSWEASELVAAVGSSPLAGAAAAGLAEEGRVPEAAGGAGPGCTSCTSLHRVQFPRVFLLPSR